MGRYDYGIGYICCVEPVSWLRELRTPELLIEATTIHREAAEQSPRPAVAEALTGDRDAIESALSDEERDERQRDRLWWQPLRAELEPLRHAKRVISRRAISITPEH